MKRSKSTLTAIRLMIQAAFTFSLMALFVKAATRGLPSMEVVFFRSLTGLILIFYLIRRKKTPLWGSHRKKLVLRGLSGFAALAMFFHAISSLPLGTAVLLNYTSPFFVVLLSRLTLHERITPPLVLLTFLCFTGVYLLVEGTVQTWNWSVAWGLLSAFLAGVSYVTIRSIRHRESPLTIIFYFTGISTVGSAVLMAPDFTLPHLRQWLYLGAVGVCAFFAQLWLTIALRRAPASLLSPFSYLTPVLSFLYGVIFWEDPLQLRGLAGIVLVITGGVLITHFGTLKRRSSASANAQDAAG